MKSIEKFIFNFLCFIGAIKIIVEKQEIEKIEDHILSQVKNDLYLSKKEIAIIYIENGGKKIFEKISKRTKQIFNELGINIKLFDSIKISSYHDEIKGRQVKLEKELDRISRKEIDGLDVIVLDDVIQTGETTNLANTYLALAGASKITFCYFVRKTTDKRQKLPSHYIYGIHLETKMFLVGYGLDFCDELRELNAIIGINPIFYKIFTNIFIKKSFISLIKNFEADE